MPITDNQRELMRNHIGASNAAACIGLSRWRTPADMFWYFTDGIEAPVGDAAHAGNLLEPSILDWFQQQSGLDIVRNQRRVRDIFRASHDALVKAKPQGVEAKAPGILWPESTGEWGEPETDEIPQEYVVQCQVQAFVSDLELVWVPALIAHRGFMLYKVERDEEAIRGIVERCAEFWHNHVMPKVPPADSVPSIEIIKRLRRTTGKSVELDEVAARVVEAWDTTRDQRLGLEKGEDALKASILNAMGDAEIGVLPDGREFCYLEQKGAPRVDFDALKADGLFDKYVTQGAHRVARIRKGR